MTNVSAVMPFKAGQYYVLDGGFSTQLSKYVTGVDQDPLWTARSLIKEKNSVVRVHRDFLASGARVILTNTYQASKDGFREFLDLDEKDTYSAMVDSVKLAWKAVDEEGGVPGHILVGGSVGPYGACQHDGSEYTGSYLSGNGALTQEELVLWHKDRIEALHEGGVSFIAVETMPAIREAMAVLDCVAQTGVMLSAWVSFTLKDELTLAGGETVEEAVKTLMKHKLAVQGRLVAVGFNCSAPGVVTGALKVARRVSGKLPFVVYPNSGEVWGGNEKGWEGQGVEWVNLIEDWVKLGATIVGGCCRVGADTMPQIEQNIIKGLCS